MLQDALDLLDRDLELVLEVGVLGDEVDRTGLDRGDRVVDRAVAGEDDDRHVGEPGAKRAADLDAAAPARAEVEVEHGEVGVIAAEPRDGVLAVVEADHARAAGAEHVAEQAADLGLIVDADDGADGDAALRAARRGIARSGAGGGLGHGRPRSAVVHSGSCCRPVLSVGRVIVIVVPRPSSESTVIRPW